MEEARAKISVAKSQNRLDHNHLATNTRIKQDHESGANTNRRITGKETLYALASTRKKLLQLQMKAMTK